MLYTVFYHFCIFHFKYAGHLETRVLNREARYYFWVGFELTQLITHLSIVSIFYFLYILLRQFLVQYF